MGIHDGRESGCLSAQWEGFAVGSRRSIPVPTFFWMSDGEEWRAHESPGYVLSCGLIRLELFVSPYLLVARYLRE